MTEIVEVEESHKADYMALFLLADPSEKMVAKYLGRGDVYVLFADGAPACVAVVTDYGPGTCELKNLATDEALQNRGYAGQMLRYLFAVCADRYEAMYVGTSVQMIPFYERFGFVPSHRVENFFVDFYPEPIFENGVQCVDMEYLKRRL